MTKAISLPPPSRHMPLALRFREPWDCSIFGEAGEEEGQMRCQLKEAVCVCVCMRPCACASVGHRVSLQPLRSPWSAVGVICGLYPLTVLVSTSIFRLLPGDVSGYQTSVCLPCALCVWFSYTPVPGTLWVSHLDVCLRMSLCLLACCLRESTYAYIGVVGHCAFHVYFRESASVCMSSKKLCL